MHKSILELITWLVVFSVNFRYVFCDVADVPSLPITIVITLLLLFAVNLRAVPKSLIIIGIILSMSFLRTPAALAVLDFFLLGFLLRKIPKLDRVLFYNLVIMLMFVCGLFFLLHLGVIEEVVWVKNGIVANTLGFSNPNSCALYLYAIIVSLYYFSPKGIYGFVYKIALIIFAWGVYVYTSSRTGMLGLGLLFLCDVFFRIKVLRSKMILYSIPIILMGVSFYLFVNYIEFGVLDVILSGRLSYIGRGLVNIGIVDWLIGFQWQEDIPVDSAYATLLSSCGLFGILIHYTYFIKHIRMIENVCIIAIIISILLAGLTEYVFVGLNMVSIILLVLIQRHRTDGNLHNSSRI